jgi:molybdopterin synthase sulfur carrier subunit
MENGKIKLLFFGITHEITGRNEMDWSLEGVNTVGELKMQLENEYPKLKELRSFAIAVNEVYAAESDLVKDADHIALIPPVSGG